MICNGRNAGFIKNLCHIKGMFDADTESQALYLIEIRYILFDAVDDLRHTNLVIRIQIL